MKAEIKIGAIVLTAILLTSISSGSTSAQSASLVYDDFEDGQLGTNLGGAAGAMSQDGNYNPNIQIIDDAGRGGKVLKITYSMDPNKWCGYWSFANDADPENPPNTTIDVSSYAYLSLWVKGTDGGEDIKIELKTDDDHVSTYTIADIGTTWRKVDIPLSSFMKPSWIPYPVNLTNLRMVNIVFSSQPWQSTVYIDDIKFTTMATVVSVKPPATTVAVGNEFPVDIYVEPRRNVSGLQVTVRYNNSLLTCTRVENGSFLGSSSFSGYDNKPGALLLYGTVLGENYASSNGTFMRVYFKAMQAGTSNLNLENLKVAAIENGRVVEVYSAAENGTVTIINVPAEDVNMDGKVDILDLVEIGYHYGKTGTPGWIRADVNRDGKVDITDLSIVALLIGG